MSFGQQSSESEQSSGLLGPDRGWFSNISPGRYRQFERYAREAGNDPAGLAYMPTVDKLIPIGEYGLPTAATAGVRQLGRDTFNTASGSRSLKGFNSPQNLEAVLGDAMRMVSGTLLPLSTDTAFKRAQMAPALRQAAFGYKTSPMQILQQFLASSSQGSSASRGFGFDTQIGQILNAMKPMPTK